MQANGRAGCFLLLLQTLSHIHSHISIYGLVMILWLVLSHADVKVKQLTFMTTIIKDKMNWGGKNHRQEQKQMLPLEIQDGTKTG